MKSALEWSTEFDLMYNNITSNQAPGLTEHEKSVFLTRAQEGLVKDIFSGKTNPLGEGFDDSERRQADFAYLIQTRELADVTSTLSTPRLDMRGISKVYNYPTDFFLSINEQLQVAVTEDETTTYTYLQIVPLAYTEYQRLMMKPYKYPPKGTAWRLLTGKSLSQGTPVNDVQRAEVIARFPTDSTITYVMRYVKRPAPINLPDTQGSSATTPTLLPVNGSNALSLCELPEHLHDEIMQRAVLLAKLAWNDAVAPKKQD